MDSRKIAAVVMIVLGILGLAYGGFSFTTETHEASVGPLQVSVNEKKQVNVPIWAGVGAIVLGGVLLVSGGKR